MAFEKAFGTLGVIIDFSELDKGMFSVCNNPERVKGLIKTIDFHLKAGKIRHAEASSLRRKFPYAECQHLSGSGAMATRALGMLREQLQDLVHLWPHRALPHADQAPP